MSDASDLETEFLKSSITRDDIDYVEIRLEGQTTPVQVIQPSELIDTPLGLSFSGSVDGLDVSLDAENQITAEVFFTNPNLPSTPVNFTVASGGEPISDVMGSEPQNEIAQLSVETSSNNNEYNASTPLESEPALFTRILDGSSGDDTIRLGTFDLGANGEAGDDKITGNNYDNLLNGGDGDDTITGGRGNDRITITDNGRNDIDGGDGFDTVIYAGNKLLGNSFINRIGGQAVTVDGADILTYVEFIQFIDARISTQTLQVTPVIQVGEVAVPEGNSGNTRFQLTFDLSTPAPVDVQFDYSTTDFEALAGEDYVATSGQLVIPAGETTAAIDLEIIGDRSLELDEKFAVSLSEASGATFINDSNEYAVPIAIENDDEEESNEEPEIEYITLYGDENDNNLVGSIENEILLGYEGNDTLIGNEGTDVLVGSVGNDSLSGGEDDDLLIGNEGNDTIEGGSGKDNILPGSGTNTIDGGAGIDAVIYGDLFYENGNIPITKTGNSVIVNNTDTLVNVEFIQFADAQISTATLEIVPVLEVRSEITVSEGDSGEQSAFFTFNLSSPATTDVQFNYNTLDDDAIAGEDYVATSGIATIAAGETSTTVEVKIIGDVKNESNEAFILNLSNISGATFLDNEAEYAVVANIENDDTEDIRDPEPLTTQIIAEYGVVDNLTHESQTISLSNNFTNPVVFAQPLSFNSPSPAAVRLDNVTENSFDVQAQEANYLDGSHSAEQVSYFVIEAGTWQLPSGEILQVGTTNSDQLISDEWENITFDQQFETIPAVFSQVQTKNDSDFVRTRQKSISTNDFQFGMEEEEANKNSGHANETLGWFAIEEGQGTWNGNNYQIGTTGDTVTHNWSSIDFDPNLSQAPQFLASLSSYDGSDPSGLRYRNLNEDTVEIKIEEDTSFDNETVHTTETVSYLALEGEGLLVGQPQEVFAETGTLSLTDAIETINLTNTYDNPVVFVQPPSFNGPQPALVRLDNITNNSFDARIQEPDYLVDIGQGSHSAETVSYFVFEAGTWQLEDGTLLEIGNTNSSGLVNSGAGFETVVFDLEFDNTPVVISQVQTENETDFVRTRQRNTTLNSFDVAMEEEEANEGSGHATETIGYLAIEPGSGESGGFTYHADNTGDTVGSNWTEVDFNGLFAEAPQVLAGISSYDGFDPAGLRSRNLDPTGVEFKVEEEQSMDEELSHTSETVDYLLIEGSGSLSATPIDPFSANGAIPITEAISDRERLISQFEDPLFEVAMD